MYVQGMPVLHLAAMLGNLQNVQQLLSHGSYVTAQDQQVGLPYPYAAYAAYLARTANVSFATRQDMCVQHPSPRVYTMLEGYTS